MFFVFTAAFAAASGTENRVRLSVLCWMKFKCLGFGSCQRALGLVEVARKRVRKKGK
jgi:hypothetical protein